MQKHCLVSLDNFGESIVSTLRRQIASAIPEIREAMPSFLQIVEVGALSETDDINQTEQTINTLFQPMTISETINLESRGFRIDKDKNFFFHVIADCSDPSLPSRFDRLIQILETLAEQHYANQVYLFPQFYLGKNDSTDSMQAQRFLSQQIDPLWSKRIHNRLFVPSCFLLSRLIENGEVSEESIVSEAMLFIWNALLSGNDGPLEKIIDQLDAQDFKDARYSVYGLSAVNVPQAPLWNETLKKTSETLFSAISEFHLGNNQDPEDAQDLAGCTSLFQADLGDFATVPDLIRQVDKTATAIQDRFSQDRPELFKGLSRSQWLSSLKEKLVTWQAVIFQGSLQQAKTELQKQVLTTDSILPKTSIFQNYQNAVHRAEERLSKERFRGFFSLPFVLRKRTQELPNSLELAVQPPGAPDFLSQENSLDDALAKNIDPFPYLLKTGLIALLLSIAVIALNLIPGPLFQFHLSILWQIGIIVAIWGGLLLYSIRKVRVAEKKIMQAANDWLTAIDETILLQFQGFATETKNAMRTQISTFLLAEEKGYQECAEKIKQAAGEYFHTRYPQIPIDGGDGVFSTQLPYATAVDAMEKELLERATMGLPRSDIFCQSLCSPEAIQPELTKFCSWIETLTEPQILDTSLKGFFLHPQSRDRNGDVKVDELVRYLDSGCKFLAPIYREKLLQDIIFFYLEGNKPEFWRRSIQDLQVTRRPPWIGSVVLLESTDGSQLSLMKVQAFIDRQAIFLPVAELDVDWDEVIWIDEEGDGFFTVRGAKEGSTLELRIAGRVLPLQPEQSQWVAQLKGLQEGEFEGLLVSSEGLERSISFQAQTLQATVLSTPLRVDEQGNGELLISLNGPIREIVFLFGQQRINGLNTGETNWKFPLTGLRSGNNTGHLAGIGDVVFQVLQLTLLLPEKAMKIGLSLDLSKPERDQGSADLIVLVSAKVQRLWLQFRASGSLEGTSEDQKTWRFSLEQWGVGEFDVDVHSDLGFVDTFHLTTYIGVEETDPLEL